MSLVGRCDWLIVDHHDPECQVVVARLNAMTNVEAWRCYCAGQAAAMQAFGEGAVLNYNIHRVAAGVDLSGFVRPDHLPPI